MKYCELSDNQKKLICNGCGAKGGIVNPPDFIFKASCNHHDFLYWVGNTEEERKYADKAFYKYMKIDISEKKGVIKKAYYHIWAYAYYRAVRLFGKKYFNYGDKNGIS